MTRATQLAGVRRQVIDGVPVVYADAPGPFQASLTFRVGQADETLPTRGITHLVEHLALSSTAQSPHIFNGATGSVFTSFVSVGEPEEVVGYLRNVCTALGDLPVDRLEHERRILASEAAQRGGKAAEALAVWRWGPAAHGLMGYEELGCRRVDADEVTEWARTWFTASNAALWLSGPPPAGLSLPLHAGEARPTLPTVDPVIPLPAAFSYAPTGVGLSFLVSRRPSGTTAAALLARRLQNKVRHELGLAYGVAGAADRVTAEDAYHLMWIDALPENAAAVQDAVIEELEALAHREVAADEVSELKALARLAAQDPTYILGQLDYVARCLLLDVKPRPYSAFQKEIAAVTPADVQEEFDSLRESLLLAVPDAEKVDPRVASMAPLWSEDRVIGVPFSPTGTAYDPAVDRLIRGGDGLSLTRGSNAVTVRYADVAAVLAYNDGTRTLIGNDGLAINVVPNEWNASHHLLGDIDRHTDPALHVPMGDREVAGTPEAEPTPASRRPPWLGTLVLVVSLLAFVAIGFAAIFIFAPNYGFPLGTLVVALAVGIWQGFRDPD